MTNADGILQMVRADISVRDFQRWSGVRRLRDPDHAMHCLLIESFGALAPKPFRLIAARGGSIATLYGYRVTTESEETAYADLLRDAAATFADPLQCRILRPDTLQSKCMPAIWRVGVRLGFDVRTRPIVRQSRRSEGRTSSECDAFVAEAIRYPDHEMPYSREQVYARWLGDRFRHRGGAALEAPTVRLASFRRTRAVRSLHGRYSEGPDAILRGILRVTDPDDFTELLSQGVGRHRSYGYGMILLRPVSS